MEPYRTARQIAEVVGVTAWTIRDWTRDGRIPAYRPGGKGLRYLESEVRAAIAQTRTVAPTPAPVPVRSRRRAERVAAAEQPTSIHAEYERRYGRAR